jgi:uncharacterized protein YndB with AHSA1/START domain
MKTIIPDRIERKIQLRVPRSRVWLAIADSKEFGTWFGVRIDGPFLAGQKSRGRITHKGYEHLKWEITVERIQPETLFSFRWHPHAVEPTFDYSKEFTTLVEFRLEDVRGGTELSLVESGFDRIPEIRRAEAFHRNAEGWTIQMGAIEKYVTEATRPPVKR